MKQVLFYTKRLFSKRLAVLMATVLLVTSITGSTLASFGPDRETRAWSPGVAGFDEVRFNSFTGVGNGVGDERDFLRGVQVGRDSVWSDPVANVTQQSEVEAKIYIHNGADARQNTVPDGNGGFKGIAKDVKVRVNIPTGSNRSQDVTAYISAANATPVEIFDTLTMTGANNGYFELAFVPNSAKLHDQNGTVTDMSDALEQALLSQTGANIGDQKGCFEFTREITFRMKVNMPRYTIKKQVTLPDTSNWGETQNVNPGDTVSWLITFQNTGHTTLRSVKIVDEVPAGLTVVPGSIKLTNGNYPYTCVGGQVTAGCDKRYVYPDSAIQKNGRHVNVDVGDYNRDGIAYVSFRTKVADAAQLTCGLNTFENKAFATPQGYGAIFDTATATATRTCATTTTTTTPKPQPAALPKTGPAEVVGLFGATTALGAVAHSIRRRR
jgi:uncharacterized repeat protein (TIGR01451 family)